MSSQERKKGKWQEVEDLFCLGGFEATSVSSIIIESTVVAMVSTVCPDSGGVVGLLVLRLHVFPPTGFLVGFPQCEASHWCK